MDVLTSSRIQFGFTIAFHYIYPPLVVACTATIYWIFRGKVRLDRVSY